MATTWASEGIDVSDAQGPLPGRAIRNAGIGWAYVKATEGTTLIDKMFYAHVEALFNADIHVGAYNYWHPNSDGGVVASADAFSNMVADVPAAQALPPMCDVETLCGGEGCKAPHAPVKGQEFVQRLVLWLETVEGNLNRRPVVYLGEHLAAQLRKSGADLSPLVKYPLMVAAYHTGSAQNTIDPWPAWSIWQWTDGGAKGPVCRTAGLSIDRSRSVLTLQELLALGLLLPKPPKMPVLQGMPDMYNAVRNSVAMGEKERENRDK